MFKNNKVILLVLLIIAAFVGYSFMFKKDNPTNSDLSAESEENGGSQLEIGKELMATLSKLKSIKLDETFFKDPTFNGLTDFSVAIAPQEVGRNNPFSPIGAPSKTGSGSSSGKKSNNSSSEQLDGGEN